LPNEPKPLTQEEVLAEPEDDITQEVEPEPEEEKIIWPQHIDFTVAKGDTLAGILDDHGITPKATYNIIEAMKGTFNLRYLREGHKLHLVLDKDTTRSDNPDAAILEQLSIILDKLETVNVFARPEDKTTYRVEKETKELSPKLDYVEGTISEGSSLAGAATSQGVPHSIITTLIKAYSYDIDFQRSIKAGDTFEILYEKLVTPDGTVFKGGNVNYALLKTKGKTHTIFYYEDKYTPGKFYNEKGESIVKTLLRTPVDGASISSGFGKRRHPILGYNKMHAGIDFAAPTGTKIFAAGNGTVVYAARKGGYGNFVSIKHNNTYTTNYAHASKFARGIRKGKKVRQGQVIAYVGSTGRSTGPHLHYEIVKNGRKINPNSVKFLNSGKLSKKQLSAFKKKKATYTRQIADIEKEKKAEAEKTIAAPTQDVPAEATAEKSEPEAPVEEAPKATAPEPKAVEPIKQEPEAPEPLVKKKPTLIERTKNGLPIIKIDKN